MALSDREITLLIKARERAVAELKRVERALKGLGDEQVRSAKKAEKSATLWQKAGAAIQQGLTKIFTAGMRKDGERSGRLFASGFNKKSQADIQKGFLGTAEKGIAAFGFALQGGVLRNPKWAFALGSAVLVATVALAPVIGTALAGGIVLAFGAGIAAIPMIFAFKTKKVTKVWGDMVKKLGEGFTEISKPFEKVWIDLTGTIMRLFNDLKPTLKKAFEKLAPGVSDFFENLADAVRELEPIIGPVTDAFIALLDSLGPALPGMFAGIADSIIAVAEAIQKDPDAFTRVIEGLFNLLEFAIRAVGWLAQFHSWISKIDDEFSGGLEEWLPQLPDWLEGDPNMSMWENLQNALGNIGERLGSLITETIPNASLAFADWVSGLADKLVAWVAGIPAAIAPGVSKWWSGVKSDADIMLTHVKGKIDGVVNWVKTRPEAMRTAAANWWKDVTKKAGEMQVNIKGKIDGVVAWVKSRPAAIASAVSGWWTSAVQKAQEFRQRAQQKVTELIAWVASRPAAIASAVRNWWTSALQKAQDFKKGVLQKITDLINWFKDVPNKIKNAVGNLGSTLWNAGRSIIQGLIDGVQSKFDALKRKLNDLTSRLPDWKGPMSVDLKLLHPSGEAIMSGLMKGIADQIPLLKRQLAGISDTIQVNAAGGPSIQAPRSSGDQPPSGDAWVPNRNDIQVNVYTQEINPKKHAADLGWEIDSRLGGF